MRFKVGIAKNEREKEEEKKKERQGERGGETMYIFGWQVNDVACRHAGVQIACRPIVLMTGNCRCSEG